ncbi:glycosyltransferase [Capilliphycus salinus ALCB114379]|uniref:glycosyltransferase n=1 Tax=Capilliphycus salinus TaxID=2768948 RepID=UPI0039A736C2
MKIAILTSGFPPVLDGVSVSGLYRVQKLSQWGHEVLVCYPDYSPLADLYPNWSDYVGDILPGVRVIGLESMPMFGVDFERNVSWKSYPTVVRELERFQPDVIHVDEPERLFFGFFRLAGLNYAKKVGIPCVSFFRTNFIEYAEDFLPAPDFMIPTIQKLVGKIFAGIYNAYDRTLVSSRITVEKLRKMGIKNLQYANLLGFDAGQFHPNLRTEGFFKQRYGLTDFDRKVKLIFLGRLTPDKGWAFTLRTFERLVKIVDPDRFAVLIAGDGPMRSQIQQHLSQLIPSVHLFGRVPPAEVPAILANSDVHVTASEKEARGLTILEAFAVGIPAIAPAAGGVVENIQDGKNGFLYAPQDGEDFAEKLKQLIENETLRKEMGFNGFRCIGDYSWDRTVKNLVEIWEAEIAEKKRIQPHPSHLKISQN